MLIYSNLGCMEYFELGCYALQTHIVSFKITWDISTVTLYFLSHQEVILCRFDTCSFTHIAKKYAIRGENL